MRTNPLVFRSEWDPWARKCFLQSLPENMSTCQPQIDFFKLHKIHMYVAGFFLSSVGGNWACMLCSGGSRECDFFFSKMRALLDGYRI